MMRRIVKQGPFVFLKDLVLMELALFVLLFLASFAENYEMLYKNLGLARFLHYNLFILVASSFLQIFSLVILFANWYFSYFEISEKEITRKSGLFLRRKKSVSLHNVVSVETHQTPLDRIINHATIVAECRDGRQIKMRNVSNFTEYAAIIKNNMHNLNGRRFLYDARKLIEDGEGPLVEFKETLRFDIRTGRVNKEMERAVAKTVVGFLNAGGGAVLLGVSDDGKIAGLQRDYESLPKKNRDGFENHLKTVLKNTIGLPFAEYMDVSFQNVEGKDICIVNVRGSHRPAYLKNDDDREEFFVRVGNSTEPFSMSEAAEYIRTNFRE